MSSMQRIEREQDLPEINADAVLDGFDEILDLSKKVIDLLGSSEYLLTEQELAKFSDEDRGSFAAFNDFITEAINDDDAPQILSGFEIIFEKIKERKEINRLAFKSSTFAETILKKQEEIFYNHATSLFFLDQVSIDDDGKAIIATRQTNLRGWINQRIYAALSKPKKNKEIDSIVDDVIKLTPRGIKINNVTSGSEGVLYPWPETKYLAIECDGPWYFDGFNAKVAPMASEKSFMPWGIVKLRNTNSNEVLVRAPMKNPKDFQQRAQTLKERMVLEYSSGRFEIQRSKSPITEFHYLSALDIELRTKAFNIVDKFAKNTVRQKYDYLAEQILNDGSKPSI